MGWIWFLTEERVNPMTWTDCKLSYFLLFFFRHYSSALLVIMCIEKFIALYFPLKIKSICTVKIAKQVCLFTALLFVLYDFQRFFVYDKRMSKSGYPYCTWVRVPPGYKTIYYHIESALYSFGPFTIMIIANFLIIYKFMMAKWRNRQSYGTNSTSQALSKSATRGTAMLITVSVTFIMLTGPTAISVAIEGKAHPIEKLVLNIMQYLNHSINGVLYCLVGSKFRNEFMKLFCYGRNTDAKRLNCHTSNLFLSTVSNLTPELTTGSNVKQMASPM